MKSFAVVATLSACSLFVGSASAQTPEPPDQPKKLEWKRPKFAPWEYAATGTLLAGLAASQLLLRDETPRWRGGILVDNSVANFGRADTRDGELAARRASDYLLYGMAVWPYLDAGVALGRGSPEVAWQMSLINTQAYALNGLATFLIKRTVRRERPNESNASSFLSGHASTAFTSAGLVCAHHGALPIYGNKVADVGACVTALAAATTTGALRVVGNVHYASDVFAGATLGLVSGWLLPKLIHYSGSPPSDVAKKPSEPRTIASWSVTPQYVRGGAMIVVNGVAF